MNTYAHDVAIALSEVAPSMVTRIRDAGPDFGFISGVLTDDEVRVLHRAAMLAWSRRGWRPVCLDCWDSRRVHRSETEYLRANGCPHEAAA